MLKRSLQRLGIKVETKLTFAILIVVFVCVLLLPSKNAAVPYLYRKALRYSKTDRSRSIRYFEFIGFLSPRHPFVWSQLCGLYSSLGNYRTAETACRKQIEVNPSYEASYYELGNVLSLENKLQDAEIAYREAIRRHPSLDYNYLALADLLERQSRLFERIAVLNEGIKNVPAKNRHDLCESAVDVLFLAKKYSEAEQPIKCALENGSYPNREFLWIRLGYIYELESKKKDAQYAFRQAKPQLAPDASYSCLYTNHADFSFHYCVIKKNSRY